MALRLGKLFTFQNRSSKERGFDPHPPQNFAFVLYTFDVWNS